MKRVFLLFVLLISAFLSAHAQTTVSCPPKAECSRCLLNEGQLRSFHMGGCEYRFWIFPAPSFFPDDECSGWTASYTWDFGDGSLPVGPTASVFQVHNYTSNGTYDACVTVTISDGHGVVCCYKLCVRIVVDCVRCDILDCTKIETKPPTKEGIQFTFPLKKDCPDCPNPTARVGWKGRYDTGGWNYTGVTYHSSNDIEITGLDPCREYTVIIEVRCFDAGPIVDFCTFNFMTDGCISDCEIGFDCDEVEVIYVLDDYMAFEFQPIKNCPNCPNPYYNVGWRVKTTFPTPPNPWNYGGTTVAPGSGTGSLFSLNPCTTYEFVIELKCPDPSSTVNPWQTPTVKECVYSDFMTLCPQIGAPGTTTAALPAKTLVYPNPARDEVSMLIISEVASEGTLQIFNNLGVLVRQVNAQTNALQQISVSDLGAGVYYYYFNSDDNGNIRTNGKLTIVR